MAEEKLPEDARITGLSPPGRTSSGILPEQPPLGLVDAGGTLWQGVVERTRWGREAVPASGTEV